MSFMAYRLFLLHLAKWIMNAVIVMAVFIGVLDFFANVLGARMGNSWLALAICFLFILLAIVIRYGVSWGIRQLESHSAAKPPPP